MTELATKPLRHARGQQGTNFIQARFEVLREPHRLAVAGADFLADADHPITPRLEVCHTDNVLVAHPQRKVTRRLPRHFETA